MKKPGPKPVNMEVLNQWEGAFDTAFHMLRDGMPVPRNKGWLAGPPIGIGPLPPPPANLKISQARVKSWIRRLEKLDDQQWLRVDRLTKGISPNEPIYAVHVQMACWQKADQIRELRRYVDLRPRVMTSEIEHRELWKRLAAARTFSGVKKACEEWSRLADSSEWGERLFPRCILANAREFLRMKRDRRFPKSGHPAFDESRLEYLARGMAGIMAGVSPMTGIERLRNMKHAPGGALWRSGGVMNGCACWRCARSRLEGMSERDRTEWWSHMKAFMEIVEKQPKKGTEQ